MKFNFEALLEKLKKIFIESEPEEITPEVEQINLEPEEIPEPEPELPPEPEKDPVLVKLSEFRACTDVATRLMERVPVFLDLSEVDYAIAKRALDFLGGAVYVLQGTLQQVDDSVFYLTVAANGKDAETLKCIYAGLVGE